MNVYLTADEQAQILLDAARDAYPRVCECPFPLEICDHSYEGTCLANRVRAQGIVAQERIERERNKPHPNNRGIAGWNRVACRFCGLPVDGTDTRKHEAAQHGVCFDQAKAEGKE